MNVAKLCLAGAVAVVAFAQTDGAEARGNCGFSWAVPGEYRISGNFRGRTEQATVRLSTSCRVYFNIPGVFSGGPVTKAGSCLTFNFRVQNVQQTFVATWCNDRAVVPWQGRDMQVRVSPFHKN